jgi:AcrR family transcriptional regulator
MRKAQMTEPEQVETQSADQRVWGGTTLAERRAARRAAFLEAALDLIGKEGESGVTVRSLCRQAGLTDRYFYESFASRDELLGTLYREVAEEMYTAVVSALPAGADRRENLRVVVETMVSLMLDDPRKGRLITIEPFANAALSEATFAVVPTFTRLIRNIVDPTISRNRRAMIGVSVAGAIGALMFAWLSGTLPVTREELIDHGVEILENYLP